MNTEEIIAKVKEIVTPIIENEGAYLVDLNLKGMGRSRVLEIFVDTDTGITVSECARISRQISDALDQVDPIPGSYRLEVSSPGVGVPFKVKRQYVTNLGRYVKIKYKTESSEDIKETAGVLSKASDDVVEIELDDGSKIELKYEQIIEAKTEIIW